MVKHRPEHDNLLVVLREHLREPLLRRAGS